MCHKTSLNFVDSVWLQEASKEYWEQDGLRECTGVGFVTFKHRADRDRAKAWFLPG